MGPLSQEMSRFLVWLVSLCLGFYFSFLGMFCAQVWSSLDVRWFVDTRCTVIHAILMRSTGFGVVSSICRSPGATCDLSAMCSRCAVIREIHMRSTVYDVVSCIRGSLGVVFTLRAIGSAVRSHSRDIHAEHKIQHSEQHSQERGTDFQLDARWSLFYFEFVYPWFIFSGLICVRAPMSRT